MAKPKLALIPAAQGSKLFSVLPSSGVGDFDFTRSGSATRINSQGLIETVGNGVSRLNYPMIDGKVVGCPHHILEPVRTNLITHSEDFSDSSWVKLGAGTGNAAIVTDNYAISPDGTQNASRLQCDLNGGVASSGNQSLIANVYSSSGNQTISVYLKSNNEQNQNIYFANTQTSGDTITITSEWQRFEFSYNTSTYVLAVGLRGRSGGAIDDTADILIWGAQAEAGSYPTSYIKTNGSAVTRAAETANGSGDAATFNDSEGVLMFEGNIPKDENVFRNISISDGSSNNFVTFYTTNTLNKITYLLGAGGQGAVFGLDYFFQDITIPFKIALVYSSGRNEIWVNGIKVKQNSNTFNLMSGLNQLSFDNGTGSGNWYGNTKQVQYFETALIDSELETLTSWVSFSDMAEGQLYSVE